jgi:cell division protein FtsI (penicillin-binding protein 3)
VGGKSGTVRKQHGKTYLDKKYRSFFVGLAPVDAPRVVVAVMLDEPSQGGIYGGVVAAPVFSATVQHTLRILGVPPDMHVQPHIVADVVEEVL